MSSFHTDWKAAHSAAVVLARQINREVGLGKAQWYDQKGFEVFMLPKPENRQGRELACEVVRPGDPL